MTVQDHPTTGDLDLPGVSRRVALVTGGGRGIGRAIALGLAADGFDVAVNFRRDEAAAAVTTSDIESPGGRAVAYRASVDDPDAALGLAEAVVADFGTVDTLVCNARIASRGNTVVDTELGEVDRLMRTHVTSAFLLCKALVPAMRLKKRADAVRFLVSPASGYLTGQVVTVDAAVDTRCPRCLTTAEKCAGERTRTSIPEGTGT